MTPVDHYLEAERLLELVETCTPESVKVWGSFNLAAAQVHATLALAGATALAHSDGREWQRWADVATADPAVA